MWARHTLGVQMCFRYLRYNINVCVQVPYLNCLFIASTTHLAIHSKCEIGGGVRYYCAVSPD